MATFDHAYLRDVGFANQVQRIRMQLATPSTRSACVDKLRYYWTAAPPNYDQRKRGHAVLTRADVVNIYRLLGLGARVEAVAKRYAVRPLHIKRIRDGKVWRSLWPGASTSNGSVGPDESLRGEKRARPAQFTGREA